MRTAALGALALFLLAGADGLSISQTMPTLRPTTHNFRVPGAMPQSGPLAFFLRGGGPPKLLNQDIYLRLFGSWCYFSMIVTGVALSRHPHVFKKMFSDLDVHSMTGKGLCGVVLASSGAFGKMAFDQIDNGTDQTKDDFIKTATLFDFIVSGIAVYNQSKNPKKGPYAIFGVAAGGILTMAGVLASTDA